MAITRAQQAKQMLQNGGRIGLRFGNRGPGEASRGPQGPAGGASAGGNYGGNRNPSQDYGGRDTSDDFGQFERRQRQNQELQGAGFLGKDLGMNIGEQDRLAKLGDVIGGLPLIRLLRSLPQGTRPVITPVGGGGDSQAMATIPMWMQLGFNSEAEYLASLEQDEDKDKEAEEGLRIAFRADGGRIGLQEGGGIEQRLEKLGGDVSSAEQMLQGINQRLKTAESSLGSGGVGQDVTGNNPIIQPQPAGLGIFAGRPIQLPGIQPSAAQDLATQVVQSPQQDPNIFGYDPSGSASVQDAYSTAQQAAEEARKKGFAAKLLLPGEMSFEDFSNMFGQGGLQPLKSFEGNLGFPTLESINQFGKVDFIPRRGGPEMFRNSGIPAAGYADGGNVVGGEFDFESARQMYGLGKLVKKVTKTVKKIAKSPIGKAALLYAGTGGLGNLAAGQSFFSNFASPSTFLGGARNIFSTKGIRNILVGRPESIISPGGKDIFRQAATRGIFGTGGDFNPFTTTAAISLLGALTPEEELQAQELADSSTDFDLEKARNSILAAKREQYMMDVRARGFRAEGGPAEGKEPVAKKTMPLLDMGGQEMDLRAEGGFVPIGRMEKADDVPARLSKNEFVFTADAVRNAGDGDVDKGAEVMYNMMKNLEAGGEVSEESQGLEGARKMFQTSQRLEEVL